MSKKILLTLLWCVFIYLGLSIPAAQADFCEHSLIRIENQSMQELEIIGWEAQLYSQITTPTASKALRNLPPGTSVYFEVHKLSFLIQNTGGKIRLRYKTKLKKVNAQLTFIFQPFMRSCIPKDMTQNPENVTYHKIYKPAREQSELVYVFYN